MAPTDGNTHTLEMLQNQTGWFCPCSEFNDVFDSNFKFNISDIKVDKNSQFIKENIPVFGETFKNVVFSDPELQKLYQISKLDNPAIVTPKKKQEKTDPIIEKNMELLKKYIYEKSENESLYSVSKIRQRMKVFSLSTDHLNEIMWAHYASEGKGICIEYDFSNLGGSDFFTNNLFPVLYSDTQVDLTNYIKRATHNSEYLNNPLFYILPVIIKKPQWSPEKEWRIISPNNKTIGGYNEILPKPKTVFLGYNIENEYREKIIKICSEKSIDVKTIFINNFKRELEEADL